MRFHCGNHQRQVAPFLPQSTKKVAADAVHLAATWGVIRLGLEPKTHTLKVYCSTN